ncbi:hypothetical protein LAZ67_11001742 [Cordylochernes scorpioides]|uniref:Reverse transcriptase domain-containing protein n=1 Tax=Cordylochernes scorpioides TaxID=51811 RepID=A0ABY6KYN1_9ARAC|nr:hypothetical protein LAZ67_11001742 [Cordylochernes scorpioides]
MSIEEKEKICNIEVRISPSDPILDPEITSEEIGRAIRDLKNNKASGPDDIPNEIIKVLPDSYTGLLEQFYNRALIMGHYPTIWTKSIIHPIFKSGDKDNPSNYRGIALISNLSKLFTTILRSRLNEWVVRKNVIPENQAGFRRGRSCVDLIFTLTTLIQLSLRKKRGKLYVFFVDLRKAFDTVPHSLLWKKLTNLGVSYQFIHAIRNYYEQATVAVRWRGSITENIKIHSGVLQGEPLSPLLFILFMTDLIKMYDNSDLTSVYLPEFGDVHLLMYADDIAIIGESRINLQKKINMLKEYLGENYMTLNESKSKVMVFRNGGKPSREDRWYWNATDTFEMLNKAFPNNAPKRTTVFEWHSRFKAGRISIEDDPRQECPTFQRTDENVQKITDLIKENPRTTLLELEQDTGISKTTIGRIVTEDLRLKKAPAKFTPRFLTNEPKLCRLATCEDMLEMTRTDPEWKDKIITGDETWVYGYDPETKRQTAEWRGQGEPRPKKSRILKSRNKVLLVAFLDNKGIVHHEYLPAGQTVIKEMPEKWTNGDWILHHDNARPHTAHLVTSFLAKNGTEILPQPPYSPDIAPNDFFLFPKLKAVLKGRHFDTREDIIEKSLLALKSIPKEAYKNCFDNWEKRWRWIKQSMATRLDDISRGRTIGRMGQPQREVVKLFNVSEAGYLVSGANSKLHGLVARGELGTATRLEMQGLYARKPAICVPLTPLQRKRCLAWCREHINCDHDHGVVSVLRRIQDGPPTATSDQKVQSETEPGHQGQLQAGQGQVGPPEHKGEDVLLHGTPRYGLRPSNYRPHLSNAQEHEQNNSNQDSHGRFYISGQ